MTESLTQPPPQRFSPWRILRTFLADIFYLPRWQQLLLSGSIIAAGAMWLGPLLHPSASSPWLGRTGASLVIGFIVGWLFRTFTKIMALLALAATTVIGGLSYFHILN